MNTTPKPIDPQEVVDCLIKDDLIKYISDSDVVEQIIQWIHEETNIRKIFIRTGLKLFSLLLIRCLRATGDTLVDNTAEKLKHLLKRLPFYNKIANLLMKLSSHLKDKIEDRKIVDDILSGKRPPNDKEYGKTLSQDLRVSLKNLEKIEDFRDSVESTLDNIIDLLTPQPPLLLNIFERTEENRLNFRVQRIPFTGRQKELEFLQIFLDDKKPFMWCALIGSGGMGKSRLSLEFCLRNAGLWRVGFLPAKHGFTHWADWQPDQPTLIIVDYASGRAKELNSIITSLQGRMQEFEWPVRIIILEREAQGNWWDDFIGTGSDKYAIQEVKYKEPLELKPMSKDDIWNMMCFVINEYNRPIPDKQETLKTLGKIDPEYRPLFAVMAAEAIAIGEDIRAWDKTRLLEEWLKREEEKVWKPANVTPVDKHLLALATMVGGFPKEKLKERHDKVQLPELDRFSENHFDKKRFESITGQEINDTIPPLEPDIIGEFFVLSYLDPENYGDKEIVNNMRLLAWEISPYNFGFFLFRAVNDFHNHPVLPLLIKKADSNREQRFYWAQSIIALIISYDRAGELIQAHKLYEQLVYLATTYPDEPALREEQAKGAYSLIYAYSRSGKLITAIQIHEQLVSLAISFPDEPAIREMQATSEASLILAYSSTGKLSQARILYEQLVSLAADYPDEPAIRKAQAIGIVSMIISFGIVDELTSAHILHDQLVSLAADHPKEPCIRENQALGGVALINAYGRNDMLNHAQELYEKLVILASSHPDELIIRDSQAKGAINLIYDYGRNGKLIKAYKLYVQLVSLATSHPDEPVIREDMARGAFNLISTCKSISELYQIREIIKNLKDIAKEHPEEETLIEIIQNANNLFENISENN